MNDEELYAAFHERMEYDPETGELHWRKSGKPVGHISSSDGYIHLGFMYKRYCAHRVVWFMEYGEWPKNDIDHRDRDRTNNRLSNLRDVTRAENMWNAVGHHNSVSSHKGVSFDDRYADKWCVRILDHGRLAHYSRHATKEEAAGTAEAKYAELGRRSS